MRPGRVSLVGAGPGDPELWTVRAARLVREADLVLYDALVDAVALRGLTDAPCFHVGKRAGRTSVKQETIHKLMIRAARHGKHVVRLKGGDPFVFGRGAEEAMALAEAGIPFEIVPGVTTAVAAAELAGIPVTHRGVASGFVVLAGHTAEALDGALGAIAPNSLTVVVMMAVAGPRGRGRAADGARLAGRHAGRDRVRRVHGRCVELDGPAERIRASGDSRRAWPACSSWATWSPCGRRCYGGARTQRGNGGRDGPAGSRGTGGDVWPQLTKPRWSGAEASTLPARRTSTSSSNLLGKFERGEMAPDDWRRYRLTRGTYGQRQDGVQMLRVKAPQGIVSSGQMRAFATVASKYSRGFGHVTTRQNIQLHFVLLKDCEDAMRILADEGLTTREACGNAVRNVTGCPYMGTSSSEIFDVYPYAEALTRYFLRHPLAAVLPRKFKIAFEGCTEDHALASINDIGWRAKIQDGKRGFRVTIAGGTSIMPVSGYVLYEFLPVEEMQNVAEAVLRVFHKYGDYEHRQRNRMKFVVKQLGWEAFRAKVMEELEAFVATRRRAAQAHRRAAEAAGRSRLAAGAGAVGERGGRGRRDAGHRPRHHARLGEAADRRRSVRALGPDQRGAAEAGRLLPRDRAAAARRHDRGPDARARRPRRGLWRRDDAAHGGAERALQVGEEGEPAAVLRPHRRGGPGRGRRQHARRRRELPGRRELPPGGDAVARARPRRSPST